jgi:hypothetical protein
MSGHNSLIHKSGLTTEHAQAIWGALSKAITQIQNGDASKLRFEELYR